MCCGDFAAVELVVKKFIKYYLAPGFIFQSAIVAGGYGTGREVIEYISRHGAVGGLVSIVTAVILFMIVLSLSYEFGRMHSAYDYHSFMRKLLGRGWIAYEILLLCSMVVINAVVLAASGAVASDLLPVPAWTGMIAMLVIIAALNYFGRNAVVTAMGTTAICVTSVMVLFALFAVSSQPLPLIEYFSVSNVDVLAATSSGATFAMYSCLSVPLLMFAVFGQETRSQAFSAGAFAAVLVVVPAILLHVAFLANLPELVGNELPTYRMLGIIDKRTFTIIYLLVLFVTVVQTGVGVMHGLNERISESMRRANRKELSPAARAMIAAGAMILSLGVAQVGIVNLVARGYTYIAIGMIFVYIIPLFTIGVYQIFFSDRGRTEAAEVRSS